MALQNGFLILDKPTGITSAKAVAEVKGLLKCKKIGHGGTLDPLASGVLPLAIGEATKAVSHVMGTKKEYRFTMTFGEERTTADAEGEVMETTDIFPTKEEIEKVLPEFIGTIMQTPPVYSALKVDGIRAYELARAGEAVEMEPRPVEIYDLQLLEWGEGDSRLRGNDKMDGAIVSGGAEGDDHAKRGGAVRGRTMLASLKISSNSRSPSWNDKNTATFSVTCGKGTYIRSLAQDIARKCSSLGYVSGLRRVAVGRFHEDNAISLDKLKESVYKAALPNAWVPIELALDDIPAIDLHPDQAALLRHGQVLPMDRKDGNYMALCNGHIVALAEVKSGQLRSQRIFNI